MHLHESNALGSWVKRTAIGAALIFGLAGGAVLPSVSAQDVPAPASVQSNATSTISDVAERLNPAVVTITNLQVAVNPFSGQAAADEPIPVGAGSGFIIDEDGHVVTNFHVVQGGDAFEVRFIDGTVVPATLVGGDRLQDVAVLKLELEEDQRVPATAPLGDSDSLRAGDQVIAIGSPFGELTNSVTSGIVNAIDRQLDTGAGYALPNLIQHDANIYPGNSGGPLINLNGEVVGINVAKAVYTTGAGSTESIGFAIEIDIVKEIVTEILADGHYDRAYLGVETQPLMSSRRSANAGGPGGQGIVAVVPDSPADAAGLLPGDIVTAVDGVRIDQDNRFVNLVVLKHRPGDKIILTVQRDGTTIELEVTLGTRPAELDA